MRKTAWLLLLFIGGLWAQTPAPAPADDVVYICPMDPDVRSHSPGNCARCGMALVSGLPDAAEYHLEMTVTPPAPRTSDTANLKFVVHDPWKDRTVANFQLVHEKLFHMFVVSQDLEFFLHDHPTLSDDKASFNYSLKFPKSGMFRVLGDFYPDGGTPQLIAKTIMIPGPAPAKVSLTRDYSPKTGDNLQVELTTDPPLPLVGQSTQLHFQIKPGDGLEKLLGAWGHMLAGSDDLIDLMHVHPFIADGGPQIEFNVIFPRARMYRVWVQFQRSGVVNTVHFDVPVKSL